ncbi:carbohydrate ABC transporter permease [Gracilibacillus dipsosauri]|uniref:Sugar ABC transporter permease n=1 Tax=Gracilibacillus dipsosauri TaxID=178340 RepID=A0A317L2Q3_9BACI|nr:carbohydrate ABC transporter permease [Gracilibacillus dipsosauri]PWU69925.1 sugar ABC transporter permease [Gracilibacillus dipsosauri]
MNSKLTDRFSTVMLTTALFIVALMYLFPILWLLLSSLKPGSELFSYPLSIIPENPTVDGFVYSWSTMEFIKYFWNTLVVAIITTVLTVIASATCGYALAKYHYKWLNVFLICMLATTMLPTEVIMTPTFSVILDLGLYDSLSGLIIPSINTATGIFMFRQYFMTVPNDLIESARIDGANEGRIFFGLMLPIAKPVVITLAIFSFQWRWNDYIWPLIVLSDPNKYTVQIALRSLIGADNIDWVLLLSSSIISLVPMILIFIVFQRYIMDTGATSGLKG